jgi:hypothetical protein
MWRFRRDWVAGAILLPVGLWLLSENLFPQLTPVIPLVAGVLLVVVVLLRRSPDLLVIAGVLVGLGVGILVARGGDQELVISGLLACLGAGFALAWLLGLLLHMRELRLWPLVPAVGLIALAAVLAFFDLGTEVQRIVQDWWPIVLVVYGGWLMLVARTEAAREEEWAEVPEAPGRVDHAGARGEEQYRLPAGEPSPLRPGVANVDPDVVPGAGAPIEPLPGEEEEPAR